MTIEAENIWQGRDDPEDAPHATRWHHQHAPFSANMPEDPKDKVGIIGFCCDEGVARNKGRIGAAAGPMAFRDKLKNIPCHDPSQHFYDFGDIMPQSQNPDQNLHLNLDLAQQELADRISAQLPSVRRLLVIGGGHETAFGSFLGLRNHLGPDAHIGIINLDAHFDLRRPGAAGNSSGTPFYQIRDLVGPDHFHYLCLGVGRESNTTALFKRAQEWGVTYVMDSDIEAFPPAQTLKLIEDFSNSLDALYLTIDLDVLPHYQMPGVSAPAARGVSLAKIELLIDQIITCASNCPSGLPLADLVELNPSFDPQGVSARTAALLADRILTADRLDNIGSSNHP